MDEERYEELAGDVAVERAITLPADPDSVWEHLTDGNLVGDWMGGDVEIEARPGGRITMTPEDGSVVWGTVEEIIPGRRLQWSWRTDDGLPTQVEIEIEPSEEGTDLTVRETLLPWKTSGLPPRWVDPPYPQAFLSAAA
ncbi:MAG TPA: SRPBCC family protein [Acidimicrobiia bacterium]|nr:SRPBCC family protein [Acidimicrobiia bacterium]